MTFDRFTSHMFNIIAGSCGESNPMEYYAIDDFRLVVLQGGDVVTKNQSEPTRHTFQEKNAAMNVAKRHGGASSSSRVRML